MAASAEPVFIRPLAELENRGAMSIGIAHMGPIVNSEKKNARLRKTATHVRLCNRIIGSIEATEQTKPATTRFRRAFLWSPDLSRGPAQYLRLGDQRPGAAIALPASGSKQVS